MRFPTTDAEAWHQATSARYVEYDTKANVELHARAAAVAADSGRVGEDIVYLTNSAAGLRAQLATALSSTTHIKGIVAYESIGFIYPDGINITAGTGGFGPYIVSEAQFRRLADLAMLVFVWGDLRAENSEYVRQSIRVAGLVNTYGGNATVVMLGEVGVKGATHIPFKDEGNGEVGNMLEEWLGGNGLDGYVDGGDEEGGL